MIKLLISCFCLSGFLIGHSQVPTEDWQNTIGGTGDDRLYSSIVTSDGGFLLGGWSLSGVSGDKSEDLIGNERDYWIVKTNSTGAVEWDNTIGGNQLDHLYELMETSDGDFLLVGYSNSDISGDKTENSKGGFDYWVVKVNQQGTVLWDRTIGGDQDDFLLTVDETTDGGYILGGQSNSGISGDKNETNRGLDDYWVVKLDGDGTIQWQRTIGGSLSDRVDDIHQSSEGGYIVSGHSASNISGDKTEDSNGTNDYWIVKLDPGGNISWQNTIGGDASDSVPLIQETSTGNFIVAGRSVSGISGDKTEPSRGGSDYWVLQLNTTGSIVWQKTIGGSNNDIIRGLVLAPNDEILIGGTSDSNSSGEKTEDSRGGEDYWILLLDNTGTVVWQKTLGGDREDDLRELALGSNGDILVGGHSQSSLSGDKNEDNIGSPATFDYWVIKLDSTLGLEDLDSIYNLNVYPNPVSEVLTIQATNEHINKVEIFNMLGQIVLSEQTGNSQQVQLNIEELQSGFYVLKVQTKIGQNTYQFLKN